MGSKDEQLSGVIRFIVPDFSVGPEERSLFGFPGNVASSDEEVQLLNFRTADGVAKGPEGLDVQGFAYVKHRSALSDHDQWSESDKVEEIYLPEVEELVCRVTGAKKAIANNVAIRRKLATENDQDPKFFYKKDCPLDVKLRTLNRGRPIIMGQTADDSMEPARIAHIDYSIKGLRDSARYCRNDIKAAAQPALDAEDAKSTDVPRYAAYSVWRPLKTVKRDPLAVCDWRSINPQEALSEVNYRAPSEVNDSGDYILHAIATLPPQKPIQQKWYWMPDQQDDEVLIVKFADTAADLDQSIAGGCPHASPNIKGLEAEEARNSVETRVFAFW